MKKTIRLNESDLQRVIIQSVKRILNEGIEEQMDVNEENVSSVINGISPFKIKRYSDFLCVTLPTSYYKPFNECMHALEDAFGVDKVTGDAAVNSIYINL